jgi:hypothetical protein
MKRLAALIFALFLIANPLHAEKKNSNCYLECWYDAFNNEYFDGKLPRGIPVFYDSELIPLGYLGNTSCADWNNKETCKIQISPEIKNNRVSLIILLHESCHVATSSEVEEHGPKWHQCMHRLFEAGAYEGIL